MADIMLGLFAILAGGFMLFAGQLVLRFVLPIWGFFAGFAFGAGLFAELADERFLGTVLGWVAGIVCALIFAVLAYLYFAVAVILAMAAFGFAIGSGVVVAIAGAVSVVAGLMLMVGAMDSADFTQGNFTKAVQASWGWYLTLVVLALLGIVAQTRQRLAMRRSIQETWYVESR